MTNEEFDATVRPLLVARPFRPYAIQMNDGTRYEIDAAMALGYRDGGFGIITQGRGPRFFKVADVRQIITAAIEMAAA